jgi:hypothetical protein
MRRKEYIFTSLMDEAIRKDYRTGTGNGEVKRLAEILKIPRWRITRRAREIGAYEPKVKEPDWSEREITVLERNAHKNPETIRRSLLKHGYKRSIAGIILKRKRLRLPSNLEGYSACKLAECFGVDNKVITRWIEKGWLKAEKRGTRRTEKQGGDAYYIKEKDIRQFIVESIGVIDIRKVEKTWFVDVVANAA